MVYQISGRFDLIIDVFVWEEEVISVAVEFRNNRNLTIE